MLCDACGHEIREGSRYCNNCGTAVHGVTAEAPGAARSRCVVCGMVPDPTAVFCGHCGAALAAERKNPEENPEHKKPKKRKITIAVLGSLLLLCVGIVITGLLTDWFGLMGPFTRIAGGAQALVDAGSLTAEFTLEMEGKTYDGTLVYELDKKERELTARMELELDGTTVLLGICDGYLVIRDPNGRESAVDVRETLESLFDDMDRELDLDELLDETVTMLFEALKLEEYVDQDEAKECLKRSLTKLNTTSWLKENAGFTIDSEDGVKLYVFEPKPGKLVTALMQEFEGAFEDPDDFETVMDDLKEREDTLNEQMDLKLEFGIKGGKLVLIRADGTVSGNKLKAELQISDIGSTKVPLEELKAIIGDK